MVDLASLVDVAEFRAMIDAGYIKEQRHPLVPLTIFNYTPKTQYERAWNDCTRIARGLIVHSDWMTVEARPFPKFFNLGELSDDEIPQETFEVYDKMDGSLGILYPLGDIYGVATRGSFASQQAKHATEVYNNRYDLRFAPKPGLTYLFEIIYPENRIVVDYGDMDDLVLLDVIDIHTGESRLEQEAVAWPGRTVKSFAYSALEDLLAAPQRENEEGYVIRFASGMRAKLKHEEYVRLHRIITGVSTKTIWEHLSSRKSLADLLNNVPDEFYEWVRATTTDLQQKFDDLTVEIQAEYRAVDRTLPAFASRKDFAERACRSPHRAALFRILDNKPLDDYVWKALKPVFEKPFVTQSEDVA